MLWHRQLQGLEKIPHVILSKLTLHLKYICVDSVAKLVEHFYEKAYRNMLIVPQAVARLVKAAN